MLMRKIQKAAKIVWEADRKRGKDRLGADVSLCSAFWSRLFLFARSQRGFVAGCGMALGMGDKSGSTWSLSHNSSVQLPGPDQLEVFSSSVNRFGGRYLP
jgi:hypothetical protein